MRFKQFALWAWVPGAILAMALGAAIGVVGALWLVGAFPFERPSGVRQPDIQNVFDIGLDENRLTYTKEPCNAADREPMFFIHLFPMEINDLPLGRQHYGFDNLDFQFSGRGTISENQCSATVELPNYRIATISTGQYDSDGKLWSAEIKPPSWEELQAPSPFQAGQIAGLPTHLYMLDVQTIQLEPFAATGGAIARMHDDLLVATPRGRLATISAGGILKYLEGRVPMNDAALESHEIQNDPDFRPYHFRVTDILLKEQTPERFDLFVSHNYFTGECVLLRVSATTLVREGGAFEASSWRTIFDAEPCLAPPFKQLHQNEGGGGLLADGASHLLLAVGDLGKNLGGDELPPEPQNPDLHLGKLLRINIKTGKAETMSLGHRNSQGIARDGNGNLWMVEHGPQGGDELNLIKPGVNYGWPYVSYGVDYAGWVLQQANRPAGSHDRFAGPVFAWVPSVAVSSLIVNDEQALPLWKDDLLIASLWGRFHGQSIFRVRHRNEKVEYVERIKVDHQLRDISHASNSRFALLLDKTSQVLFLKRSDKFCREKSKWGRYVHALHCGPMASEEGTGAEEHPSEMRTLSAEHPSGAVQAAMPLYRKHCGSCHHLAEERHQLGPHLVDLIGRPAGKVDGYGQFSPAFQSLNLVWTRENLRQFLLHSEQVAPGTSMPKSLLTEAEATAILDYIASQ